jgi:hypothetical protein
LQAVYHPRIDYKKVTAAAPTIEHPAIQVRSTQAVPSVKLDSPRDTPAKGTAQVIPSVKAEPPPELVQDGEDLDLIEDEDDAPLPDVPALPRVNDAKSSNNNHNGVSSHDESQQEKQEESGE